MLKRCMIGASVLALLGVALLGCAPSKQAPAKQPPAKQASLVGQWTSPDTAGKDASLSDITFFADGRFRYAGKSAIGSPVAFTGTYQTGSNSGAPTVTLVYADFPDRPTFWYYQLDGNTLKVSAVLGNLTNGSALTFTRK
ncbi:MAG: hypothetical protein P4L93_05725 [Coriobacteriia bacterium]|nr:hypothetical protein [Coriobacteriia bacterium]